MEFRPKTQEQIQAQVEHFADKGVKEFSSEQKLLLKHSKELSKITDLDNVPEDLQKLIENNRGKYLDLLRSTKKEEIDFRKENIELYNSKFKSVIDSLKEKMSSSQNPKDLPAYLGSGSNGSAYIIEVDGKKYAAKFSSSLTQANFETKPLLHAKGIENVAQLISYSFADGVVIMELLHGRNVNNFTPENAPEYSDEHIEKLILTVIDLYNNGITIDPKASNFMYDEINGFSILDFLLSNRSSSIGEIVMWLKVALTHRDFPYLDYKEDDYEQKSKAQALERNKIELPMMIRFLTILQNKFPEVLEDWKKAYQRKEEDPRITPSPLINRKYMEIENPEIKPYLTQLEAMGF